MLVQSKKIASKLKRAKYGVVALKICVPLLQTNVIEHAYTLAKYKTSKRFGSSFLALICVD
jgi:hypothetical protein